MDKTDVVTDAVYGKDHTMLKWLFPQLPALCTKAISINRRPERRAALDEVQLPYKAWTVLELNQER
jgi:hypothetical protein